MLNYIINWSLSCICNSIVLYYQCFQCIPVCFRADFRRIKRIYIKTRGWWFVSTPRTRNTYESSRLRFEQHLYCITLIEKVIIKKDITQLKPCSDYPPMNINLASIFLVADISTVFLLSHLSIHHANWSKIQKRISRDESAVLETVVKHKSHENTPLFMEVLLVPPKLN